MSRTEIDMNQWRLRAEHDSVGREQLVERPFSLGLGLTHYVVHFRRERIVR